MSNQSVATRVQSELTQAVQSGLLPQSVQSNAERLLARINQPVRLALLGLPDSGKSTLLNLLVGKDILPSDARLPTLQLTYGDNAQAICTLADGSKQTLDRVYAHEIAALSPVYVELQMPLPALAKISILEVVAPNDPQAMHRASQWAAKKCDVALWCTTAFGEDEQNIWAQMPDLIKDHAFLMLTKADRLHQDGIYDATMNMVRNAGQNDFNQVLPIATTNAIAARQPDGSVDKELMRQSGGLALISGVLKQVEQGRQSAVDMADVLLAQNAAVLAQMGSAAPETDTMAAAPAPAPEPTPQPVAEPEPTPAPEVEPDVAPAATAPAETIDETPPTPAPAEKPTGGIVQLREMAAKAAAQRRIAEEAAAPPPVESAVAEPEPAEPDPAPAEVVSEIISADGNSSVQAATDAISPETRAAYEHVIAYLEEQGDALVAGLAGMGPSAPTQVMELSVTHIQWLCDYLNDNGDDADPSLQLARDTAFDAADMVQLMQMEKRDSAALEAVTLMLQIKRELQANLAA